MIRDLTAADVPAVQALDAVCHPAWPAKPAGWWWAHPTLVLELNGSGVVGATSCAISLAPATELVALLDHDRAEIGWGHGVEVAPGLRGQGWGWRLAEARHQRLAGLGIRFFLGMTQPDNAPMLAIFARQRLHRSVAVPRAYPDGSPGVLYTGGIV